MEKSGRLHYERALHIPPYPSPASSPASLLRAKKRPSSDPFEIEAEPQHGPEGPDPQENSARLAYLALHRERRVPPHEQLQNPHVTDGLRERNVLDAHSSDGVFGGVGAFLLATAGLEVLFNWWVERVAASELPNRLKHLDPAIEIDWGGLSVMS